LGIFAVTAFVARRWPGLKDLPPLHQLTPDRDDPEGDTPGHSGT
jgi:hypothetical protein